MSEETVRMKSSQSIHDRTLDGMSQVIERALNHVRGVERAIVSRGVQIIHPKVEQRIKQASEDALRAELRYLHELLGDILQESPQNKPKRSKRRRQRKSRRSL